jgi:bacillithiol system protein YtxJ
MNWIAITEEKQLEQIREDSKQQPVVILKHSTRCSISSMAKNRLDRETPPNSIPFYYLDLIRYRAISNKIAEEFNVHHESPQVLIIKNGECTYDESHNGITMADIAVEVGDWQLSMPAAH